jgi:predicted CoA-substrate-specific enzyme activase
MITLGCDIGSLFSKAVVLDEDEVVASRIIRTTGNIADEIGGLLKEVMKDAGLSRDQVDCMVGTGKGANFLKDADFIEDEINCVGVAASYYLPEVRLTIEVGGQSITSILLGGEGEVINYMRNDKCASGSGRFLEVMSEKLDVGMSEIDEAVKNSQNPVEMSNQCAVFAESEVITYLNNGEKTTDIIAGVCGSVAKMVAGQGMRFTKVDHYTITGGVAKIGAITNIVHEKLPGAFHRFPHDPQFAAAIGAALLGDYE